LQIATILDSAQKTKPNNRSVLEKNIASLRREKDRWKNFMEEEQWNREKVHEVETAWRKRYSLSSAHVNRSQTSTKFMWYLSIFKHRWVILFCHQ